jgi:8-oxo-dGTP pyrophosphatase MutT (NUDIX family)
MTDFRDLICGLVAAVEPLDAREADDRAACLAWIASGAPLCRTAPPATPPQHLVAYAVAVDPDRRQILLADHRQAGLWLPTGGHVEPEEHPATAARRELHEELGIDADPLGEHDLPVMVTVTTTAGTVTPRHVDVSLWYAFRVDVDAGLRPDPDEFRAVRWWPFDAVGPGAGERRIGPGIDRFLTKVTAVLAPPDQGAARSPS